MSVRAHGTILVADDNPSTRYVTVRTLRAAEFETVEAANGVETLAKVDSSIDLVVLDINMPDIDGYEVCRLLRAAPATATIPIIHLSARSLRTWIVRGVWTSAPTGTSPIRWSRRYWFRPSTRCCGLGTPSRCVMHPMRNFAPFSTLAPIGIDAGRRRNVS